MSDIDIAIGAQDKATAVINAVAGRVGGLGGTMSSLLTPQLAAVGAAVGGAVAGFLTLKAAIGGVMDAAGSIDPLNKAARGMGESVGDLQAFQFAMGEIGGLDAGKATASLQKTQEAIGKAVGGDAAIGNIFEKLQLDAESLSAQGPVEQFEAIRNALGGIENTSERAAAAQQIFGKSARDLLPVLLSNTDAFASSMEAAESLGMTVSSEGAAGVEAMNDAIGRVKAGFAGVANQVAVAVAPLVETIATKIASWIPPLLDIANAWLPSIIDSAAALIGLAVDYYTTVKKFITLDWAGAIETANKALTEQGTAAQMIGKLSEARARAAAAAAQDEQNAAAIKAATLELDKEALAVEEAKNSEGEKTIAALERKLAIATLGADAVEREEQLATAGSEAEQQRIAALQKQLDLQEESNRLAKERAATEEQIAKKAEEEAAKAAEAAADRAEKIGQFAAGTSATESRLLTRGPESKGIDKIAKESEKSNSLLTQIKTLLEPTAGTTTGPVLEFIT